MTKPSNLKNFETAESGATTKKIAELSKGVHSLPSGKRKDSLVIWLDQFEQQFGNRILAFDRGTAKIHGTMVANALGKGIQIGASDGQNAATAIQHNLEVITRNEKDFTHTGAKIWNICDSKGKH